MTAAEARARLAAADREEAVAARRAAYRRREVARLEAIERRTQRGGAQ